MLSLGVDRAPMTLLAERQAGLEDALCHVYNPRGQKDRRTDATLSGP